MDASSFELWADAICISQDDFRETNHHIQLMAKNYRSAELVLSFLGVDDHPTKLALDTYELIAREASDQSFPSCAGPTSSWVLSIGHGSGSFKRQHLQGTWLLLPRAKRPTGREVEASDTPVQAHQSCRRRRRFCSVYVTSRQRSHGRQVGHLLCSPPSGLPHGYGSGEGQPASRIPQTGACSANSDSLAWNRSFVQAFFPIYNGPSHPWRDSLGTGAFRAR